MKKIVLAGEAQQAVEAAKQVSTAAENEAEQLRKERIAKGDTVVMPSDEPAKFPPIAFSDGYQSQVERMELAVERLEQAVEAAKQVSTAAVNEAEQLRKERIAKGDTVAMPADEPAKFRLIAFSDGYQSQVVRMDQTVDAVKQAVEATKQAVEAAKQQAGRHRD